MPVISFTKKNREPVSVDAGANLMTTLLSAGVPVASSCSGRAVCCKCVVTVTEGKENLSKETDDEIHQKEVKGFKKAQRLSCQATILGDVELDTGYW